MRLAKGSRVNGYRGALLDTSYCGTLLDSPGTMNAFVQFDGSEIYGMVPVGQLKAAAAPCEACGWKARHSRDCAIYQALAHLHPFRFGVAVGGREPECHHCGRPEWFNHHTREA